MHSVGEGTRTPQKADLSPVFVVGNPRSGTTLVQQLLSAHAEFWTAPETHIFDHVLRAAPESAAKAIPVETLNTLLKRMAKRASLTLEDAVRQNMIELANSGTLTGTRFVGQVMQSFKRADDPATRWVEKTPQHLLHLEKIWQYFPEARVINIVRDPRDVVSSPSRFRKHHPGLGRTNAVINIAWRWNRFIERADAHTGDPRFLSIRYEDLVSDPEHVLAQLTAHAGVETDISAIQRFNQQFDQVTLAKPSADNKAFNSATGLVDRRGIWKKRLTEQEAKIIETICGPSMASHGYQKEFPQSFWASAQIAGASATQRFKALAYEARQIVRRLYRRTKKPARR